MTKWYVYLYQGEDTNGLTYTEKHYYRSKVDKPYLTYLGELEVQDAYFSASQTKYYDSKESYTRKDVLNACTSQELGTTSRGIMEDYLRLKFSYIPQLLKHFEPDPGGYYTPHRSQLKK